MDHPKYHQYREDFLNAPDWHYVSSSDEANDEDDVDGLLTPVSMTRHCDISNTSHAPSAHLAHNSLLKRNDRKSSSVDLRQSKPCSSSPRRPITRSYGIDCVSLDYRRKGFVVCRSATKNICMTFERYLRHYVCQMYPEYAIVLTLSGYRASPNRRFYYFLEDPLYTVSTDTTLAGGWKWFRSRRGVARSC